MGRLFHILALALALPSVALAQDAAPELTPEQIDRARNHFNAGLAYYEDGRWENAAREFEESYRITRHPDVLYNVAQSYDRLDRHDEAIAAYRGYLEQQPNASDRATVERRIEELEARVAAERSDPAEQPASAPSSPETESPSIVPYVVLGVGGALAIAAGITGAMALSTHSDLEETCGGPCPPDRQDDVDRGEALALWSTLLTAGAIVGIGLGVTLLVVGTGSSERESARLELVPGPTPAGAGARLRF